MAHKLNGKKLKLCLYIATMTHNTKSRASRAIHVTKGDQSYWYSHTICLTYRQYKIDTITWTTETKAQRHYRPKNKAKHLTNPPLNWTTKNTTKHQFTMQSKSIIPNSCLSLQKASSFKGLVMISAIWSCDLQCTSSTIHPKNSGGNSNNQLFVY
jgi:hypothetical protein